MVSCCHMSTKIAAVILSWWCTSKKNLPKIYTGCHGKVGKCLHFIGYIILAWNFRQNRLWFSCFNKKLHVDFQILSIFKILCNLFATKDKKKRKMDNISIILSSGIVCFFLPFLVLKILIQLMFFSYGTPYTPIFLSYIFCHVFCFSKIHNK